MGHDGRRRAPEGDRLRDCVPRDLGIEPALPHEVLHEESRQRFDVLHTFAQRRYREFENRRQISAGWFIIAMLVLAAIDYLCLRTAPSAGL